MHSRTLNVGDIEMSIAESEPAGGGRPLLLLHGFTGAKEDFTEWLDLLAEDGWHVVSPDHRGHGESSKPEAESAYSLSILADDAFALADNLGWKRFALLGHSMGGFVAQIMAFRAPSRLDALVLMDTRHGPIISIDPALIEAAVNIVRTRGMDALAEILDDRESPLETPAHRRVVKERPGYAEFSDRKFRATSPYLYAAIAPEFSKVPDSLEKLKQLPSELPALVIVGEQDTPFIESSTQMAEAIPKGQLAVIPDAGHSPQFENPTEWWKALSGFLRNVPAAQAQS